MFCTYKERGREEGAQAGGRNCFECVNLCVCRKTPLILLLLVGTFTSLSRIRESCTIVAYLRQSRSF